MATIKLIADIEGKGNFPVVDWHNVGTGEGFRLDSVINQALSTLNLKYTKPSSGIPMSDLSQAVQDAIAAGGGGGYIKPTDGIPSSDMTEAVQASLTKADTALQSSDLANYATKTEVNAKYSKPSGGIPTSDLTSSAQNSLGKADTAVQPDDLSEYATTAQLDEKYEKPSSGIPKTDLASAAQASLEKADTAVQPDDLSEYATTTQLDEKYSKPSSGIPATDLESDVQASLDNADTAYQKPSDGIPATDLESDVQASLESADTAYQKPSDGIPTSDIEDEAITKDKLDASILSYVTPEMYGAVGDGETDDTEAIIAAFETGLPIRGKGIYGISEPIDATVPRKIDIVLRLKAIAEVDYMIKLAANATFYEMCHGTVEIECDGNDLATDGLYYDHWRGVTGSIYVMNCHELHVKGFYSGTMGGGNNLYIKCENNLNKALPNSIGLATGQDDEYNTVITKDMHIGLYCAYGGVTIDTLHCWTGTTTTFNGSIGVYYYKNGTHIRTYTIDAINAAFKMYDSQYDPSQNSVDSIIALKPSTIVGTQYWWDLTAISGNASNLLNNESKIARRHITKILSGASSIATETGTSLPLALNNGSAIEPANMNKLTKIFLSSIVFEGLELDREKLDDTFCCERCIITNTDDTHSSVSASVGRYAQQEITRGDGTKLQRFIRTLSGTGAWTEVQNSSGIVSFKFGGATSKTITDETGGNLYTETIPATGDYLVSYTPGYVLTAGTLKVIGTNSHTPVSTGFNGTISCVVHYSKDATVGVASTTPYSAQANDSAVFVMKL